MTAEASDSGPWSVGRGGWLGRVTRRKPRFGSLTVSAFQHLALPPALIGLLGLLVLAALFFGVELASGRLLALASGGQPDCPYLLGDYRIAVIGLLALCWVATARTLLSRRTHRNVDRLEPLLAEGASPPRLLSESRVSWIGGVLGLAMTFSIAFEIVARPVGVGDDYWIFPHVWNWTWCIPFGWSLGRFLFAVVSDCVQVSRMARKLGPIRLFETAPLAPFADVGLSAVALLIVAIGIVSVFFLDPGAGWVAGGQLLFVGIVGTAVSGLPMLGVRHRIRDEKSRSLERVRLAIREETENVTASRADSSSGRLPDLLALEERLLEVREWPVPGHGFGRTLLYAGILLGSWLGAASVERLLESLLG